jgi:hypothetical protein
MRCSALGLLYAGVLLCLACARQDASYQRTIVMSQYLRKIKHNNANVFICPVQV